MDIESQSGGVPTGGVVRWEWRNMMVAGQYKKKGLRFLVTPCRFWSGWEDLNLRSLRPEGKVLHSTCLNH